MGCGSWPGFRAGRASLSLEPEMFDVQSAFDAAAVDGEGCGLDCLWANLFRYQPVGDTPRPGSPPSGRCGRSTVVSTEGVDSGPLDRGSAPGACEIGGLGTLEAVFGWCVAREGRRRL